MQLQFGLQPPANAVRAWGARAIYTREYIDLLPDRQDIAKPTEDDTRSPEGLAFGAWVDKVGLPWLREHVKRVALRGDDSIRVAHVDGQYAIAANPKRSFGYIYIVAYQVPDGETPDEVDTPTPAPYVHPASRPHTYEADARSFYKRKPCGTCYGYKSDPIHKVKAVKR